MVVRSIHNSQCKIHNWLALIILCFAITANAQYRVVIDPYCIDPYIM